MSRPRKHLRDPERVLEFYCVRLAAHGDARPDAAHLALAPLEHDRDGAFDLGTRNIDDLHELADSGRILHTHVGIRP